MSLARTTLTDEQLAAAGAALRSFHGHLTPDSLNHTTQISLAAMIAYMCVVFDIPPVTLMTTLRQNVDAMTKDPDLLRYIVDQVHANVAERKIISLPTRPVLNPVGVN